MTLAERLKRRMEEKGWTLAKLSRSSGVSKGYLWALLEGEATRPSAETLYSIARALGTSIADLLGKPAPRPSSEDISVPAELKRVARKLRLPEEDVRMLACIRFRNEQPKTEEDWRFLFEAIRRSIRG